MEMGQGKRSTNEALPSRFKAERKKSEYRDLMPRDVHVSVWMYYVRH